jgi:phytoene dehydrogenase-like protein
MPDVIIVGGGLGGLVCAARLATGGKKVTVLEKKPHVGGTSYVFRRGEYAFPMGPLSFSFPGRVREFLTQAGVEQELACRPSRFALSAPFGAVEYSRPLRELKKDLKRMFPEEALGLDIFVTELGKAMDVVSDLDRWHPEYQPGAGRDDAYKRMRTAELNRYRLVSQYGTTPAAAILDRLFTDVRLKAFLGSMGTERPSMSWLNLALMWNVMSSEGVWFPEGGVHWVADQLREVILARGGEVRCLAPVRKVLVRERRAAGVATARGETLVAPWVVANADYKTLFLELLDPGDVPPEHLKLVRNTPYTDSELCVYLGLNANRVDLSRLGVEHTFLRRQQTGTSASDLEDFDEREIEVCHWSAQAPALAPAGRAALVLRMGFPYDHFSRWRTGEKARLDGYGDYKTRLARKLIATVETLVPGLGRAIDVMEVATPLTYRDWGNRHLGSIAGWTWTPEAAAMLRTKLLVETPIPGLLAAGAYAATELFLGGVPTAMFTGSLAAQVILES